MSTAEYADQRGHDVAAHVYAEAQDDRYAHLVSAGCACGWQMSGFVRRELAWHFWHRHVAQA